MVRIHLIFFFWKFRFWSMEKITSICDRISLGVF